MKVLRIRLMAAPTGLLPMSLYFEDRQGVLLFFFLMIAGAVFLFSYKLSVASRAVIYGVGRRLRHMARGHRRGRDPIHPAALEPPHCSQGEQFLRVDARARLNVSIRPDKT